MRRAAAILLLLAACSEPGPSALEPLPEPLELDLPTRIDFPPTQQHRSAAGEGSIRNDGPTALTVEVEARPPFGPELRRFTLAPGETRQLRFLYRPHWSPDPTQPDDGLATVRAAGKTFAIWLRGSSHFGCRDDCTIRGPDGESCLPAPDGTACGNAHDCSDGAACSAGACIQAPLRDGAACDTMCGSRGACSDEACAPTTAPEDGKLWSFESPAHYVYARQSDETGTLLVEAQGDWIRLGPTGDVLWRMPATRLYYERALTELHLFFGKNPETETWMAIDVRTGATAWSLEGERGSPLVVDSGLLIFERTDAEGGLHLDAIDPATGAPRWSREVRARAWSVLRERLYPGGAVVALHGDELRLAVSGSSPNPTGDHRYALFALDRATGNERWAASGDGSAQRLLVDAKGRTFVGAWDGYRAGHVDGWDETGRRLWSANTGTYDHPGQAVNGPIHLLPDGIFTDDGTALDGSTGTPRYQAPGAVRIDFVRTADTGFTARWQDMSARDLRAFDLATGEVLFRLPGSPRNLRALEAENAVELTFGTTALCTLDRTGALLDERHLPPASRDATSVNAWRIGPHLFRSMGLPTGTRIEAWPAARR